MNEPIKIRQLPEKQPKPRYGKRLMLVALGMFIVSFPLIYLVMEIPVHNDLIGGLLYFCGPLPILTSATFLIGYVMFLCGR